MKRQVIFIRLMGESFRFAISAIINNRLRTLLSLLGITVGIFAIISVYSVTDSMERTVRGSIESLGENTLYIQKWPWGFGGDYPWWKYLKRPIPSINEYEVVRKRTRGAQAVAFMLSAQKTVETGNSRIDNTNLVAVSEDYDRIFSLSISKGRYFSSMDLLSGTSVAVIGYEIAEGLFKGRDPLNKVIKVMGQKLKVVGVLEKQGQDSFGNSSDKQVIIPMNFARNFMDARYEGYQPMIALKAADGISNEQLRDEVTGIMRSVRKLKPKMEDDFAINEISLLSKGFDSIFSVLHFAGWFIGGFAILVGGFGIANIMFVSVRERTPIIGIQKSLGAKRYFILFQFLFESVLLCLIGGILGLALVFAGTAFVTYSADMDILLTKDRILYGISVSVIIGLISGIFPAWIASRQDPVEAIRSTT